MGEAGFFALFFGGAAAFVSFCALRGWQAWLNSRRSILDDDVAESIEELRRDFHDFVAHQEERFDELQSRLDFAERLLATPEKGETALPPQTPT